MSAIMPVAGWMMAMAPLLLEIIVLRNNVEAVL